MILKVLNSSDTSIAHVLFDGANIIGGDNVQLVVDAAVSLRFTLPLNLVFIYLLC